MIVSDAAKQQQWITKTTESTRKPTHSRAKGLCRSMRKYVSVSLIFVLSFGKSGIGTKSGS